MEGRDVDPDIAEQAGEVAEMASWYFSDRHFFLRQTGEYAAIAFRPIARPISA
jgi:hypothetical protein